MYCFIARIAAGLELESAHRRPVDRDMVTIRRHVRPSGKEGDRRFESARRLDMRDNVELIESLWEAFASADIEAFAAAIADDGEIVFPESVPWGGSYRGPEGFRGVLADLSSRFTDFKAKPEMVLGADDDHVVVVAKLTGRGKRGARLDARVVWLYRLRDGKVIRGEAFP